MEVQVGWSSSVSVCMASAYSGISSSRIAHNSVDMCVNVPGLGLSLWPLWTELLLGAVLFFVLVTFIGVMG